MKKHLIKVGVVLTLAASVGLSSCIGSFALSNRLLSWNKTVGDKIVNELVFFAFWVLPVYEVALVADVLVINSIEFWSGSNPMAQGSREIQGHDGMRYLVKCDGKGYDIVCKNDGSSIRLDFSEKDQRWDVVLPSGESYELMTMIDAKHVELPYPDGSRQVVELSQQRLMAYSEAVQQSVMMAKR